ncbi:MAG TPA: hypothetical protein VFS43_37945 [Polyangiaceae bacterium]|nr:hypothetical protein [Polyangiaceae bacterium]
MPTPPPSFGRRGGLALTLASASAACGASYQSVYENEVHFEHCYAVDVSPNMTQGAKLQCWADWTKRFSQGQPRDRVEYALARQRALLSGSDDPAPRMTIGAQPMAVGPQPSAAPPPVAASPVAASPLPRTPYEGPPATMALAPTAPPSAAAPPPPRGDRNLSPTQLCARDCGEAFTSCATACQRSNCYNRCGELAKKCIAECL